jgi:hypothetical protein
MRNKLPKNRDEQRAVIEKEIADISGDIERLRNVALHLQPDPVSEHQTAPSAKHPDPATRPATVMS